MSEDKKISVAEMLRATPNPVRYLLAGVVVNQLGAFVQTFLVLYLTFRGASFALAGLCLAVYSVGSIFGGMLGGELTQRFGPRATITLTMGVSAPLLVSIPWLSGPGTELWLLVVVTLAGVVTQAYRPAAAVLLSDLMPDRYQVMAFSMMRIALNIGAAVAPLIAAGLILVDWDLLYWLDGATALLYAVVAFALLPKPSGTAATPEKAAEKPAGNGRTVYARMLRDRRFLYYLAASMLGMIMFKQSTSALPLQIIADGYPTGLYSAMLAVSSFVLITCELKITTYIVRIPKPLAGFLGPFVNAIGFAIYALSGVSAAFVIAGAVLAVCGSMISGPSMFAHPTTFPAEVKARYVATMHAVVGVGMAVGPLFAVAAWSSLGGVTFWLLCAALTFVAGLFAYAGLRTAPETAPVPETAGSTA